MTIVVPHAKVTESGQSSNVLLRDFTDPLAILRIEIKGPPMSTEDEEKVGICWVCRERPATATYTIRISNKADRVCPVCIAQRDLEDEFGAELSKRFAWLHDERYDDFLAWLDEFEVTNRHRDNNRWLARTIAAERHQVLFLDAQRYEESLAAYETVKKLGFEQPWQRWGPAHTQAQVLEVLGRHEEALATFEEAFRHQEPPNLVATAESMKLLVKFSENAGKPVDESWRPLIQAVAAEFRVEFPVRPTLAESITALFEVTNRMLTPEQYGNT